MAAPTYKGKGTVSAGFTVDTAVALPTAGAAPATGDLIFIIVESSNATYPTVSGYTLVKRWDSFADGGVGSTTSRTVLSLFCKIATSSESNPTVTTGNNHTVAQTFTVSGHGVATIGTDIVVGAGTAGTSGSGGISMPGITVTADSLILMCASTSLDGLTGDVNAFTSWANSNLASVTERTDQVVNTGNGGGFGFATGTCAGTTTGASTATLPASDYSAFQVAVPPASTGPQSVNISLIDQSGVMFGVTPQATISISESLIDQSGTMFALAQVSQAPHLGLIDQSGVLFGLTVQTTVSVSLGLTDNTGVIFGVTPQSNFNAAIALIDQTATIFAFTKVNQTAPLALIDQSGVLFNVTASTSGGTQNVDVALIDQSGTMFGVGANQALTLALIDQSGAVFALGQIKQTVPLGLIDQSYVMYGLTVNQRLQALGLIDQTGVINALAQVKQSEPVALIDQSGVIFTITQVKQTATLGLIDQSGVLFNVTPSLAGPTGNVSTIDQSGTMFALAAENQSLPALALIDQTGTIIGVAHLGGETVNPEAYIRWFIRTQQVCKNQHHYHYPHYDIVLSGTEYFIPAIPDGWTET